MLPEDFLKKMSCLPGFEEDRFLEACRLPPRRGLRLNLLRCGKTDFERLAPFVLTSAPFGEGGYYAPEEATGKHPWHHAGVFYLQEPSAMAAVTAASIRPGMKVLDLCAAPGGKSTQAAALLQGSGLIVCNEVVTARARILLSNIERCGVRNAVVTSMRPEEICEALRGYFDVVLVDAPCSGEGMFRREPEAAAQWRPELPAACARRQSAILSSARWALKEGGVLVYSTCTFSPEENEGVVGAFIKENSDFTLEEIPARFGRPARPDWAGVDGSVSLARRIFPQDGGEGHFVARLRKNAAEPCEARPYRPEKSGAAPDAFLDFYASQFQTPPYGAVEERGGEIRLLPEEMPDLGRRGVLRAGVLAGSLKGGRFEPAHALYMASGISDARRRICDLPLGSAQLAAFLHGEAIEAPEGAAAGYTGVFAQGFPVGFGKISDGMLKNHYPKGLRNV